MNADSHRVLVTGASGFVGRALVGLLQKNPHFETVCALRNASDATTGSKYVSVGDMDGTTDWSAALPGVRTVMHLAARVHVMHEKASNPLTEFRRVNVDGTLALARQAAQAGARRFIFVSSIKVNGEEGTFTERDTPHPKDPYGISKFEAEVALRELAASSGLEVVIIRPPLVYGPGVKANFRTLLNLVSRGLPLPLGAVHNKRSFVAVQNLSHFIVHCAGHRRAANETFLICDGDDLSTAELIRRMARAVEKPARLLPVPAWMLKSIAGMTGQRAIAQRLLGTLRLDISKARELLEWVPPVSVDEALRLTAGK